MEDKQGDRYDDERFPGSAPEQAAASTEAHERAGCPAQGWSIGLHASFASVGLSGQGELFGCPSCGDHEGSSARRRSNRRSEAQST